MLKQYPGSDNSSVFSIRLQFVTGFGCFSFGWFSSLKGHDTILSTKVSLNAARSLQRNMVFVVYIITFP